MIRRATSSWAPPWGCCRSWLGWCRSVRSLAARPEFPVPRHRHRSWPVLVGLVMTVVLIEGAIAHWYARGGQTSPRVGWTWADREDWQPSCRMHPRSASILRGSGRYWPATGAGAPLLAFFSLGRGFESIGRSRAPRSDGMPAEHRIDPGGRTPRAEAPIASGEIELRAYQFHARRGPNQFVFFRFGMPSWPDRGPMASRHRAAGGNG